MMSRSNEKIGLIRTEFPKIYLTIRLIRSSLFWSLRTGNTETKIQVLQTFEYLADQEVEQVLRQLILDPEEEDCVKRVAISVLHQLGAQTPYQAILGNKHAFD